MAHVDDDCNHILLDSSNHTRLMVWRIQQRSLLIVEVKKSVDFNKYKNAVEESLDTIEQGRLRFAESCMLLLLSWYKICTSQCLMPFCFILFVVCLLTANLHLVSR